MRSTIVSTQSLYTCVLTTQYYAFPIAVSHLHLYPLVAVVWHTIVHKSIRVKHSRYMKPKGQRNKS